MLPPLYARFAIAVPLYRSFEYALDVQNPISIGTRYRLPFTSGSRIGIMLSASGSHQFDAAKIKPALECIDREPVMDVDLLELAQWMSDYYLQPLGEVVFQCLPAYLRGARVYRPAQIKRWALTNRDTPLIDRLGKRSPRQYQICQALQRHPSGLGATDLKKINPNWRSSIKALETKGIVELRLHEGFRDRSVSPKLPKLNSAQAAVVTAVETHLGGYSVHLLDGITGSGKTEIYLRLIQDRIEAGLQVIYLVPEIGLTEQLLERINGRFGDCFVLSHSGLSQRQRFLAWDRFRRGEVSIMLGTRSSLFSQSRRLGLIIVDEEHDPSYRQQDGSRYHARDVAIKRAQMLDIPILLGSATPSLESIANCKRNTYFRYCLDKRATRFPPPTIELINLRNSRVEFGCCVATIARIERHLGHAGQVLMFLNRRGFAPVVMCHECGWQAICRHCDARLTLHQSVQRLLCHHCGYQQSLPETCPECGHIEVKHYGIGTEQLEQGLRLRFPNTPIIRIDRDVIVSGDALKSRLQQLASGKPCILIGTQMIAKGHDYPGITLSIMLDADQALFSASYRASERLLQTLFQVSGRAGRGQRQGEAIVQTRFLEHPLLQSLSSRSYRDIAEDLLQERRSYDFPPYARVVVFRADAIEFESAMAKLEQIKALLINTSHYQSIKCVGPIPALMTRRIGRFRAQLCLLAPDYRSLRAVLNEVMGDIERVPSDARANWFIDVDAYDL